MFLWHLQPRGLHLFLLRRRRCFLLHLLELDELEEEEEELEELDLLDDLEEEEVQNQEEEMVLGFVQVVVVQLVFVLDELEDVGHDQDVEEDAEEDEVGQ